MAEQTHGTGAIETEIVEDLDGITVIRGGGAQRGWNGILYQQGLSGKNAGAQNLSINVATVPPGEAVRAVVGEATVVRFVPAPTEAELIT